MKLSNSVHPGAASALLETWTPPELGFESAAPISNTRIEEMLAIFSNKPDDETKNNANTKETASQVILHASDVTRSYATWMPGKMGVEPAEVTKFEWNFVESVQDSLKKHTEPQRFEPAVAVAKAEPAPILLSVAEKEATLILERARLQAEEIILAAQTEADNVLMQADDEIDILKKEGYQQSWDKACCEIADTLKATHALVEEVRIWKTDLVTQGEQILVEMMKDIAQKMFGEGVELDTHALQINLNHIMENAHGLGNLNIFLNPRDVKILDPSWSEYQMLLSGDKVKVIPSGKITRGGAYVKGDMGVVDGRVETQLTAILKSFSETSELAV